MRLDVAMSLRVQAQGKAFSALSSRSITSW
jgi:hypothetical protein